MIVVALLVGLIVGWIVGWRLTSRSYQKLVSAIDTQNARLLRERREIRSASDQLNTDNERQRRMLERAEKAIVNARAKRDTQARIILDLTEGTSTSTTTKGTGTGTDSISTEATAA